MDEVATQVAVLSEKVSKLESAVQTQIKELSAYRTVHLRCPFNPEVNGAASEIIEAVHEMKERIIKDTAYRQGVWFGLSGLGLLQLGTFIWPRIFG